MAAGYDGSIKIDSRIDSKGFNSGLKSMIGGLGKLAAAIGIAFGVGAILNFGKTAVDAASELASAMVGLQSVIDGQGRSWSAAQSFIEQYTADGLMPATDAIVAYKNLALRGYDDSQIQAIMTTLKDSAAFGRQSSLTLGEAVKSATEGLKNENSILVDNAGVTKNVAKMWEDYAKSIGKSVAELTLAEKRQAEVNGLAEESKYQMGDAAKLTQTYAGQVAQLGASFTKLKTAIGNAIIPMLQQILPYIIQAVNWLTTLATAIGQVFGDLFGFTTDASQAAGGLADNTQEAAEAQEELGEATEDTEEAAKGSLAAFDELNVLQKPEDAATGGATAPVEVPVEPSIPDDAADGLLGQVEELKGKLLDFLQPLLDGFEKLKGPITELGGKIWDGLVWVWNNILVPLGEWLREEAAPVFFDLLAAGLEVVNSAIEALQPVWEWLWENVLGPAVEWAGQALLDVLGWLTDNFKTLSTWIDENQELFQILVGVLLAIGVAILLIVSPVAQAVAIIALIIAAVVLLVKAFEWLVPVAKDAWDWIVEQWGKLADWFQDKVIDPVVKWFKTAWEDITSFFEGAWNFIAGVWEKVSDWFQEKVIDPIRDRFDAAWEFISILVNNAWAVIKYVWDLVYTWFKEHVIDPVRNAFEWAWNKIMKFFSDAWDFIVGIWTSVSTWFTTNVIDPLQTAFETAWEAIKGFFSAAWDFVKGVWESVSTWFTTNVADPIRTAFETAFTAVSEFIKGIINGIIDLINGMISSIVDGINAIINTANTLGAAIPGWEIIPNLTAPQIPHLASGAVIPPNAEFLAVLGDQRAGRNIETPEALMRQIVREEVGQIEANIRIEFGGTLGALVRELKPLIDKENVRIGGSLVKGGVST